MLKFGRQQATEPLVDAGGAKRSASVPDDAQLIKKRARQRLVGAVILVVTAVIVLPMILDSEPRPLNQDLAITIPGKDAPFDPKLPAAPKLPVKAASGDVSGLSGAAGAEAPLADRTVRPVAGEASTAAAASAAGARPAEAAPMPAQPGNAVEKPAPVKDEHAVVSGTAAHSPAGKSDEGRKVLALLEGKTNPTGNTGARLFVQVGAFASDDKVKELQAKLKGAGLSTFTERVTTASGERIRLRLGPFAGRSEAEAALGKVRAAGVNGAAIVQ